jgi:transcriptional regulator with XRE-family HTH domain
MVLDMARSTGERIRELRNVLGQTQGAFGEHFDVTQASVWAWEADSSTPSPEAFVRLANLTEDLKDRLYFLEQAGLTPELILATADGIRRPRSLTANEVAAWPDLKRPKSVDIATGSQVTTEGKARRVTVLKKTVTKESDMTTEAILKGPTKRGEVNSYVSVDGKKIYFDAATGALIGYK